MTQIFMQGAELDKVIKLREFYSEKESYRQRTNRDRETL